MELSVAELKELTRAEKTKPDAQAFIQFASEWITADGLLAVYVRMNAYVEALKRSLPAEVLTALQPKATEAPATATEKLDFASDEPPTTSVS